MATTQGLRDLRRAQAQALGLSPAAFALLETLAQGPEHGMQVSEAASVLGVRPQALSGLAAQLASQGWLAREIDPADGRARRLSLTPQGRANLAPAHELRQVLAAKLDSLMPNPTLAKLVFRKFLQAIKESRI
jgi:DNA-binding MarR family transcriptional regulator